ncbi:Na+/H+ antiporter NhaC family protein [Pseudoalteromonas denitrificans]|uniref:Transporter, NhaC family n=1 Tax=Pseudoalteromonas denitrificans DSM 6059 TaxID=1123010 RepID=A0A1I1NC98_9GAMM|nr:Na+/H+ antiporter NhaC family protein [Pseudoalteromonas denitrificans]SFC94872.1 transporter, NhaC family [Pseudoalteromonas denitrificans DSM 6059]
MKPIKHYTGLIAIVLALILSIFAFLTTSPIYKEQFYVYQTYQNSQNNTVYKFKDKEVLVGDVINYSSSPLRQQSLDKNGKPEHLSQQWVIKNDGQLALLKPDFHLGFWSLLPAITAILLCLITREPLIALLCGVISGALLLGKFNIIDQIIIPNLATDSAAGILVLYLWLLGGLMGIWSKTGAAQVFAEYMTAHFVKGPRSAKFVSWLLGVIFFQGGTVSTVVVGTTVKPLADKANVSHEEMAYIVDSTASPIASVIAFNAWPAYVQALIFVPGVSFLATESDRINFFFKSIPFSFYGIFAVIGTLLVSLNIMTFAGKRLKNAQKRVIKTGQLDAQNARPMSAKELAHPSIPQGYKPHVVEFIFPLFTLIIIAISTFILTGSPAVHWAFTCALLLSCFIALAKGMALHNVIDGINQGLKGVVLASVILMLAITIGAISKQVGGGLYLIELLGEGLPFWCLPVILQLLTMIISFSTGTSWGTYAIAFPLAMPLAWTIATGSNLDNPEVFMMICFATVLNGSVFGDQCSPISDTTILSAMTTGCDLMDHVKSQIVPASFAASIAAILWTSSAVFLA